MTDSTNGETPNNTTGYLEVLAATVLILAGANAIVLTEHSALAWGAVVLGVALLAVGITRNLSAKLP